MTSKIVLLALNAKFFHTSLAIRYLREACKRAECGTTELLELTINNFIPKILGAVYDSQPKVLAVACYIWNIELVKQLLPLVRKVLPETVIICGGPEVSYESREFLLANPAADYVVRGEVEEVFPELLQHVLAGKNMDYIAGICYRDNNGNIIDGGAVVVENMAQLPFAYQQEEMADIKERILYYETSRGCPFACAYCLSCATKGVRYRPMDMVLQELQFFVDNDVRQVKFVDRTFNAKKSHYMPILEFIKNLPENCRTNFHFEMAIDYLDSETIGLLQSLPQGRVQLEIGIQSTNPEVLKHIQRVNHWEKIAGNIKALLAKKNMHIHTDLIIGLPGEDMESFAQSFNDVYSLDTHMLQLGFLKFLKGAAMMKLVQEYKYQYMDIGPYEVLSNNLLNYGDIRYLHIFEEVFELYHNAGRCRNICNYLIKTQEKGNAFNFYKAFTNYWQAQGYQSMAHSPRNLYDIFRSFVKDQYQMDIPEENVLDNLLRYDCLLADKGRIRPEWLNWNLEKYQTVTAQFWRERSKVNAGNVLENYEFTTWRDLRKKYQIERFNYNIGQMKMSPAPAGCWILFEFAEHGTNTYVLEDFGN